jgi:hypothetical protein
MRKNRSEDEPAADAPTPDDLEAADVDDELLAPRERQRMRRRDHDAGAEARDLMRPGMGKVFKQIQDAQRRDAEDDAPERRKRKHR